MDVSISVDKTYERNAVMYKQAEETDSYNHPVVLLSKNFLLSDHLMNIMGLNESKDIIPSKNPNILPNVFVILVISEPLIFGYEFMDGLLKQEYPKENIIICICTSSSNHSSMFRLICYLYHFFIRKWDILIRMSEFTIFSLSHKRGSWLILLMNKVLIYFS